jgi:hypothetical protein
MNTLSFRTSPRKTQRGARSAQSLGASGKERADLVELGDVAVDRVDDLEFLFVQLHGRCGAAILDHDHVGALVGQAAYGRGHALVGEDPGDHDVLDLIERVPDIRWDEIRHFVCPDHATVESVTTGTPQGGQRFEVHLVDVLKIRDGKIAAKRSYRKGRI